MKSKIIFLSSISIYIIFVIINTLLDLNIDSKDSKRFRTQDSLKNLSDYQKDINITNLSINEIWGIAKYKPKELKIIKEINTTVVKVKEKEKDIQLRDTNGFYTIIISKREFDILGVAQKGKELFVVLYDTNITKRRDAIKKYYKNDIIYKNTRIQKIDKNYILVVDSKTHTKLKVPYFFVDSKDFKPKEKNNDY